MSSLPLWGYGVVIVGSLLLSLLFMPYALAVAVRFGLLDHPGPAKGHKEAVPYLGGAVIVMTFAIVVVVATAIRPPTSGFAQLGGFMGLGLILAVIGLIDDVRGGLSPWIRLGIEFGAGIAIYAMGDTAHIAGWPGWLNGLVSVLWIVGVTNAFNLLDNMDGLSAGVATLAALTIFGIACLQQRFLVAALAVALAGCAMGFLRHNFHPAKIYMGDAGSLFLGFVLAVLLLKLRAQVTTRVPIAVILAIPGVALFDTALVVTSRIANGRNPFNGGQDHTSHRLVRLGLSVRQAVGLIYGASVVLDGTAILMSRLGSDIRIAGVAGVLALGGICAVFLLRVSVYDKVKTAPRKDRRLTRPITE